MEYESTNSILRKNLIADDVEGDVMDRATSRRYRYRYDDEVVDGRLEFEVLLNKGTRNTFAYVRRSWFSVMTEFFFAGDSDFRPSARLMTDILYAHKLALAKTFVVSNRMRSLGKKMSPYTAVVTVSNQSSSVQAYRFYFPYMSVTTEMYSRFQANLGIQLRRTCSPESYRLVSQAYNDAAPMYYDVLNSMTQGGPITIQGIYGSVSDADHKDLVLTKLSYKEAFRVSEYEIWELSQLKRRNLEHAEMIASVLDPSYCQDKCRMNEELPEFRELKSSINEIDRKYTDHRMSDKDKFELFFDMLDMKRLSEEWFCYVLSSVIWRVYGASGKGLLNMLLLKHRGEDAVTLKLTTEFGEQENQMLRYTWRTMAWFARIDSRERYKAWHKAIIRRLMKDAYPPPGPKPSICHYKVGRLVYWTFFLKYVCTEVGDIKSWIRFDKNHWESVSNGRDPRQDIYNKLCEKKFQAVIQSIQNATELDVVKDDYEDAGQRRRGLNISVESNSVGVGNIVTTRKIVMKATRASATDAYSDAEEERKVAGADVSEGDEEVVSILKLAYLINRSNSSTGEVIRAASDLFFVPEVEKMYMNSNPLTMAISDRVLQVDQEKAFYRDGFPEDYISKVNPIHSTENLTENDYCVIQARKWHDQLFPDPEVRTFWEMWLASLLKGRNADKKLITMTGPRDNAKTTYARTLHRMLGPYCGNVSFSNWTSSKNDPNAPSPDLVRCRNMRLIMSTEPNRGERLQNGLIKKAVGNDENTRRGLYKDTVEEIDMWKVFHYVNRPVPFTYVEPAVVEKQTIVKVNALYTSRSIAPKQTSEQKRLGIYPRDEDFGERHINSIARGLLWICIQNFPKYMKVRLPPCATIKNDTDNYFKSADCFLGYKLDRVMERKPTAQGKVYTVRQDVMYADFREWYEDNYPGQRTPSANEFREEFYERMGLEIQNKEWQNVSLIDPINGEAY